MKHAFFLATAIVFAGCGAPTPPPDSSAAAEGATTEAVCTYTVDTSEVIVSWVAFKYTERTGVRGQFDKAELTATAANSAHGVLQGATFSIPTGVVNTGDAGRDEKIETVFFGAFADGGVLSGAVSKVEEAGAEGTISFSLTMNGQTHDVNGTYTAAEDRIEVKASIDLSKWAASDAVKALNAVCEDLHRGKDGLSVLWPDVDVFIEAPLIKTCP